MKTAVIVFPGSNCDRDMAVALEAVTGQTPAMVWHKDEVLPEGIELVAVPGGFSFGDYLRTGAIAARSPIMNAVRDFANAGGAILGVCNGFQVLCEAGLLPGALVRNRNQLFICRDVPLRAETTSGPFMNGFTTGETITLPVAHHDGNYICDDETFAALVANDQIAFRYSENINGARDAIAGILSENKRVLGMMPHPERAISKEIGGIDGLKIFQSALNAIVA